MTTATIASPLESFQQGRDAFLAAALDALSEIESSVLTYQHQHEGHARLAGVELSSALKDNDRLQALVGEQAEEIAAARNHVCVAPEPAEGFVTGLEAEVAEFPAGLVVKSAAEPAQEHPVAAPAVDEEAARTIAELRGQVADEQRISAGLRADLKARDRHISNLEGDAEVAEKKLLATLESHQAFVRDNEATFEQRLAEGSRATEDGVRGEAVRIIEAIVADNPALAEAAELFAIAFPAEATADAAFAAPVKAADEDLASSEPPATAVAAEPALAAASDAAPEEDDFFSNLPAPALQEALPAPMTQAYQPAPELGEDAILDPNFFDAPAPVDGPAAESVQAPAPTPHGLFGRKKESSNA